MGPTGCPETSITDKRFAKRRNSEYLKAAPAGLTKNTEQETTVTLFLFARLLAVTWCESYFLKVLHRWGTMHVRAPQTAHRIIRLDAEDLHCVSCRSTF